MGKYSVEIVEKYFFRIWKLMRLWNLAEVPIK